MAGERRPRQVAGEFHIPERLTGLAFQGHNVALAVIPRENQRIAGEHRRGAAPERDVGHGHAFAPHGLAPHVIAKQACRTEINIDALAIHDRGRGGGTADGMHFLDLGRRHGLPPAQPAGAEVV